MSLAARLRAIELNAVAVDANKLAFALGRLAAADAKASGALREGHADEPVAEESLDALGADPALPFTRAVAECLARLMSYKDEYEVSRLYTDGTFRCQPSEQFEGELKLEFHLAPPLLARSRNGEPPRKITLDPWMLAAMAWLAKGRRLRGTALHVLGRTAERRVERALIDALEARVAELLPQLDAKRLPLAVRSYGQVKLGNVALARTREAELLHRFGAARHPWPAGAPAAGQLKGIAIVEG